MMTPQRLLRTKILKRRVLLYALLGSSLTVSTIFGSSAAWAASLTRGPYLQQGSSSSVIIRWRSDSATNSVVRYGSSPTNLNQTTTISTSTTEHVVQLTGLSANTRYYYSVGSSSQVLAGGNSSTYFETAPAVGNTDPFRIWVIGDSGTANSSSAAVYNAYRNYTGSTYTDLWLMLGDNAYNDGTDSEYQAAVFDEYPELLRQTVLWPTLGNHDGHSADSTTESGPYYDIFTLPRAGEVGGVASNTEAYYSFNYANAHFVVLDSYDSNRAVSGAMLTWLEQDLQAVTADWLIAFWHHPPYTKGSHDSDSESALRQMRENALPILESYGVDLVLSGHSHSYERSYFVDGHYGTSSTFSTSMKLDGGDGDPAGDGAYTKTNGANQGAVYVVAGSSGKTSGGSLNHPVMYASLNVLGSVAIDINDQTLSAKFLDNNGTVRDEYEISKAPACTVTESTEQSCSDSLDNDCDGDIDANDTDCCADNDNDGFNAVACGGTDCDDSDASIYPGATELCSDSQDNNCDGDTDCAAASCQIQTACGGSGEQTITLSAIEDSFVSEGASTTNYGSNSAIEVDTASIRKHGLVRATDISSIPSGSTILAADLVLTIFDPGNNVDVLRVTSAWSEANVTWNNRPSSAGSPVATFSGTVGTVAVDVTDLVQGWIDNTYSKYGVELSPTGTDGVDLRSSEYATPGQRPYFEITYASSGNCTPTQSFETSCSDSLDNDCDGWIDSADPDCCPDNDADGYSAASCGGSDCNDSNADIYPGATESCADSVDNDCDSNVDCADSECSSDPSCSSTSQETTLTSFEDATINQSSATSNYGNATSLEVDTSSQRKHVLLRPTSFGPVSSGAQIVSAELVLNVWDAGHSVEVHEVTSSWSESSVTWNSRPSSSSTTYATFSGSIGTKNVDITSIFQDWVDGTSSNYGFELVPTGSNGVDIRSSEYSTASLRPSIIVEYVP